MLELNKIYNEDCLEGMKRIPDKSIDLILTDPPYGVNFTYDKYNDTPENLKILVDKFMPEFLRIAKVVLITCGINNIYIYIQNQIGF
jgi:DNA modification methylase